MTWEIYPDPPSQVCICLITWIFLKKELFVSISFYCFTILILGIIVLNGGRRGLSEKNTYFVVDTVFHAMRKALYSVYFVKVPSQPRSECHPDCPFENGPALILPTNPHRAWTSPLTLSTVSSDIFLRLRSMHAFPGGIDCSVQSHNWFSLNV